MNDVEKTGDDGQPMVDVTVNFDNMSFHTELTWAKRGFAASSNLF